MNQLVLATAAAESAEAFNLAPFIAGGITAAVFVLAAIVLRSFRDVATRSMRHDVHGNG